MTQEQRPENPIQPTPWSEWIRRGGSMIRGRTGEFGQRIKERVDLYSRHYSYKIAAVAFPDAIRFTATSLSSNTPGEIEHYKQVLDDVRHIAERLGGKFKWDDMANLEEAETTVSDQTVLFTDGAYTLSVQQQFTEGNIPTWVDISLGSPEGFSLAAKDFTSFTKSILGTDAYLKDILGLDVELTYEGDALKRCWTHTQIYSPETARQRTVLEWLDNKSLMESVEKLPEADRERLIRRQASNNLWIKGPSQHLKFFEGGMLSYYTKTLDPNEPRVQQMVEEEQERSRQELYKNIRDNISNGDLITDEDLDRIYTDYFKDVDSDYAAAEATQQKLGHFIPYGDELTVGDEKTGKKEFLAAKREDDTITLTCKDENGQLSWEASFPLHLPTEQVITILNDSEADFRKIRDFVLVNFRKY